MNDSRVSSDSELDWLAFQYVAGELPADDCESFELRLAEDQAACEAVARAVHLVEALAAARMAVSNPIPAMPIAQSSALGPRWRRLAAAACVAALVLLGISLRLLQKPATDDPALSGHSRARTVSDWVALGSSDDESDEDDLELSLNDAEQTLKLNAPADDLAVPSWMVAALEHDHDDQVEED